jgi:DNA polymerase III delta prime subunit
MWIEMQKLFNEFTDTEKREIIQLNYKYFLNKLVNKDLLFEYFDSTLDIKRSEIGLGSLKMSFSNTGIVKLEDSTCSYDIKETVKKLLDLEINNPENIIMLKNFYKSYKLMVKITSDRYFANILSRNDSVIILYENNRRSSIEYDDNDILEIFLNIKKYTHKQSTLKELKKLELASMYGLLDHSLIDVLFGTVLREIKIDLSIFVSYLNKKVDDIRKVTQNIFDEATTLERFEEILENRTVILFLFDDKDYTLYH